jgi:hypothetical protein
MKINYFKQLGAYLGILLLTTYCGPTQPDLNDESRLTPEEIRSNEKVPVNVCLVSNLEAEKSTDEAEGFNLLGSGSSLVVDVGDGAGGTCSSGYQEDTISYSSSILLYKGDDCIVVLQSFVLSIFGTNVTFSNPNSGTNEWDSSAAADSSEIFTASDTDFSAIVTVVDQLDNQASNNEAVKFKYQIIYSEGTSQDLAEADMAEAASVSVVGLHPPEYALSVAMSSGDSVDGNGYGLFDLTLKCNDGGLDGSGDPQISNSSDNKCGDFDAVEDSLKYKWQDSAPTETLSALGSLLSSGGNALSISDGDADISINDQVGTSALHTDASNNKIYYLIIELTDGDTSDSDRVGDKSYAIHKIRIGHNGSSSDPLTNK